jgi:hypothetical protein
LSFSDDCIACSLKFKDRAIQMIQAANKSFIGVFLPGKAATISRNLYSRID